MVVKEEDLILQENSLVCLVVLEEVKGAVVGVVGTERGVIQVVDRVDGVQEVVVIVGGKEMQVT